MQCVKILLKQSQISKQIISEYRKCMQALSLVAQIENIFIPTHYEEIIIYFRVHWEYFHADYM